jgi:acetyl-CoA carboxylase biotin carboxyl carrier protein
LVSILDSPCGSIQGDAPLPRRNVPSIHAPITGIVWKVLVAESDEVVVEQVVILIESMKLEIPVESEHSGRVHRISVAEGDAVNQGDLLVELN